MPLPSISIAMCTYNGARYVVEQLESFAAQTLLPSELIICDDVSKDDTVALVREFAARAPFPVRLEVNPVNLGFSQNFAKAIGLATGELILCSDQDDVWHPTKLAKFAEAYAGEPKPGLIFCDANLVGDDLKPMGTTLWGVGKFGPSDWRKVTGLGGASMIIRHPSWFAFGATMGFASKYLPLLLPMPQDWSHDGWISTVVAAVAPVALVPEALNDYRQHSAQIFGGVPQSVGHLIQSTKARDTLIDHFRTTAERFRRLGEFLDKSGLPTHDPKLPARIADKVAHWNARAEMREGSWIRRLTLAGRELALGRYHSSSKGWRSMVNDALFG